jgi:hypothetical protein
MKLQKDMTLAPGCPSTLKKYRFLLKELAGMKNLFNCNPSTKRRSRLTARKQMDLHVRSWGNWESERLA